MLVGIDHLVVATPDLDGAVRLLRERLGIDAGGGGIHPGAGTANRLAWFGDAFLELIAVVDRAQAMASWLGEPTIEQLDAHGGGFVSFALASDDLRADVARLRAGGSTVVGPVPGERRRPDGAVVRWHLATPTLVGPAGPPFLIEHDRNAAEWTPAERAARAAQVHPNGGSLRLVGLDIAVADLIVVAADYRREVRLEASVAPDAGDGALVLTVSDQRVVLRPSAASTGPSVVIRLTTSGLRAASADLFDCRFILEPVARDRAQ